MNADPEVFAEVDAMRAVAEALSKLDPEATKRVIRWAADRYEVADVKGTSAPPVAGVASSASTNTPPPSVVAGPPDFADAASLCAAAQPETDIDKALVVGYWFQVYEGQNELDAGQINRELKHLGHRLSNITAAMTRMMRKKPQLVVQVRKGGTSRQARKRYRLTAAGLSRVKGLLSGNAEAEEQ